MSANIKKIFLELLNSAIGLDVSHSILDLRVENSPQSLKIISVIDTKLVPKIRGFASQIDLHQQTLAKKLKKEKVSIIFSAKAAEKKSKKETQLYQVPNVKSVILVASGKGGVGKSTIASLLALYLAKQKFHVGLLDADIYGPSIPHIFGLHSKPEVEDGKLFPHFKHGVQLMSAGFLIDKGSAAIWRGPMANKAIHQMLLSTKWGKNIPLDYLIIDTPPGTGDIHISLLEKYKIDGAIIVTTPSQLAINDVLKSLNLLKITNTEILSIVCNMSHVITHSGEKVSLFEEIDWENFKECGNTPLVQIPMLQAIASHSTAESIIEQITYLSEELSKVCEKILHINKNIAAKS